MKLFGKKPQDSSVDHIVRQYGDLVFDLCESVLWNPAATQLAFRAILKELKRQPDTSRFRNNERAWVLRVACDRVRFFAERHGRRLTAAEQIQLDASEHVSLRLKQFGSYFHRLPTEDQILLLLRDKYGLPYPEISTAIGSPEDSLKMQRQQALRTLEDWVWDHP